MTRLFLLLLVLSVAMPSLAQQQPVGFLENNGEVVSAETNTAANDVLYKLSSSTTDVYITSRGISYVFRKQINIDTASGRAPRVHYQAERVDMNLVRARISKQQVSRIPIKLKTDIRQYMSSSKLQEPVVTERVTISGIYPHTDWVVYLKKDKVGNVSLKHDFVLHPGADTRKLRIKYSENGEVTKDSAGRVLIKSKLGLIEEAAPVVYEEITRKPVTVGVGVNGQYVSYFFREEIVTKKTILDPELYWGTFITSPVPGIYYNDYVIGTNVETDSKGNIFVLMNASAGLGFPTLNPGNGAYYADLGSSPSGGIQIAKFTPAGVLVWCTFFGKSMFGTVMVVDSNDDLYILGNNTEAIPLKNNGGHFHSEFKQRFIAKFRNSGELNWCSYIDGNFDGSSAFDASDIAADKHGRIFITGASNQYAMPFKDAGNGAYYHNTPGDKTIFIMVFDASCKLVWSTQVGVNYAIAGMPRICIDGNDNIFLTANPRYDSYPILNGGGSSYNHAVNGNAAITSFNAQWKMTWSTFLPGLPFGVQDVTTDRDNNIFIVGYSSRWGFPTTDPGGGAFIDSVTNLGLATAFIMKFSPAKELLWATRFANDRQLAFRRVIADPTCDAIHVTGVMNDGYYGVPTLDNGCGNNFYYTTANFPNGTGPIYATFKTSGKQVYTSLTDVGYEYFDEWADFDVDRFGNRLYLYGCIRNFETHASLIKNPGNGAFFQPVRNNLAQASILMKLQPAGVQGTVAVSGSSCGCTKSATVTPTCGEAPFTYEWSNGETGSTVNNLCPGKYSVRVMDAACSDKLIEFEVPLTPDDVSGFQKTIVPSTCNNNNGSVTINSVVGGVAPFMYALDNGAFQSPNNFGDLAAGTYKITVRSSSGCEYSDVIDIEELPQVTRLRKSVGPAHCGNMDGRVTIEETIGGSAPYQYSLDGVNYISGNIFDQLAAGFHYIYARDNNACEFKDSFMIPEVEGISAITVQTNDALCGRETGSLRVTNVTGGTAPYNYSVDGGMFQSGFVFELPPGDHVVSVRDAFGCLIEKSVNVKSSIKSTVKIIASDTNVCYGTAVMFEAKVTGSLSQLQYSWNNGESSQSYLEKKIKQPAFVTLRVTNSDGCISEDAVSVNMKRCDSSFDACVVFPNAVTADGNGKNDVFLPALMGCTIDNYVLNIYNRYGELVFSTRDPSMAWNCRVNGKEPDNITYVYTCEYTINGTQFLKKGSFTVVR